MDPYARQARALEMITDAAGVTLGTYRGRVCALRAAEPQTEMVAFFLPLLEALDCLPEAAQDMDAQAALAALLGGQPQTPGPEEAAAPQASLETLVRQLMDACRPASLYTAFTGIPDKKLRSALKTYGDDPAGELIPRVLALYNATVTGKAKNGFLLFTGGVLYREGGANQGAVLLAELAPFTAGGKCALVLNARERPGLAESVAALLNRVAQALREAERPFRAPALLSRCFALYFFCPAP